MKRFFGKAKSIFLDLEFPVFVFPVLVTVIVAFTFIFPSGKCAAWQWWSAVAITFVLCFARAASWRRGLAVSCAFMCFLGLIWIMTNVTITGGWDDILRYHQPAIRLMIEGWNPVWQGTFGEIEAATGISTEGMRAYHVIAMPRGVWYFCASSFFFTKAVFNLLYPLSVFLFLAITYSLITSFSRFGRLAFLIAVIVILGCTPSYAGIVDLAVAIGGLGLLLSMVEQVRTGKWHILRMIVFTFWMAVSKQTGMLHCCVFWLVFVCCKLIVREKLFWGKLFTVASIAGILIVIASISPYCTNLINYGHPLYPKYTGDAEKYPTYNITSDFCECNEDAEKMGHVGSYLNAFCSSDLTLLYYRIKTGQQEFLPFATTWSQGGNHKHSAGAPTSLGERMLYLTLVVMLFVFGGRCERLVAACLIAGTFALPSEMLGYIRYTPWLYGAYIFCVPFLDRIKKPKIKMLVNLSCLLIITLLFLPNWIFHFALTIDDGYALRNSLRYNPPKVLLCSYNGISQKDSKTLVANLQLIMREEPQLKESLLIPDPLSSEYREMALQTKDEYNNFYDFSCRMLPDYDLKRYSYHRTLLDNCNRKERLLGYALLVVRSFFVTLPQSIYEVIHG